MKVYIVQDSNGKVRGVFSSRDDAVGSIAGEGMATFRVVEALVDELLPYIDEAHWYYSRHSGLHRIYADSVAEAGSGDGHVFTASSREEAEKIVMERFMPMKVYALLDRDTRKVTRVYQSRSTARQGANECTEIQECELDETYVLVERELKGARSKYINTM